MAAIWFKERSLEEINAIGRGTMMAHLDMRVTAILPDALEGEMPVTEKNIQPAGLLHGGASVALAETLGSVAANLVVDPAEFGCVGLEINANHIRAVRLGQHVHGVARPLHLGTTTQVWDIRISDEKERLTCIARLTMAVIRLKGKGLNRYLS
ncbi:MAG: hotdog fold thioesterase [Flavobacteriales bacterium]|nr:hotdog fold thioesterase [Flavobacteriales bacterium]MCX7650461.1 hotdog fold thioesterase [Flavobacteriales bacterium]MDW8432515.1 hotdog fold thioesterase [Flavobacteriales bacterium]